MPDHRSGILSLLEHYAGRFPVEQQMTDRYVEFVTRHTDCFERSLLVGHVTGSAMILDTRAKAVLLTHHRKLNRWLQPGGHADGDTDVAGVALKEAMEESGLSNIRFVGQDILDVDIHEIPARGDEPAHYHYDCRFLLQAVDSDDFIVSEESHDLAWVPMSRIRDYTDEESILRMIEKINLLQRVAGSLSGR